MLKDRRILLEKEISKLTLRCGEMYIAAIRSNPTQDELSEYHFLVDRLGTMKTELGIVAEMIGAGHE